MRFLVVRIVERERAFWNLDQALELDLLARDIGNDNLASIDFVDKELFHLSLHLVFFEVPMHYEQVLVNLCLGLLNLLEENNHV